MLNNDELTRELDRKLMDAMQTIESRPFDEPYVEREVLQTQLLVTQAALKLTLGGVECVVIEAETYRQAAKHYRECVHWSLLGNAVIAIVAAAAVLAVKAGWWL